MSKLKERGANGVVLPQESVQQLQEINQQEYNDRLKKAHEEQQIKANPGNTSISSANDSSLLINGVSPPETKKSTNTYIRPRPTPNADPSPFTRHMSLPYRSRPMGNHSFNSKGSSTYQALTDDLPAPRLQPESSSFESAQFQPASQGGNTNATVPKSQADMWLATATSSPAQGSATDVPNPFSTASTTSAATVTAASGPAGWNQPEQVPNPFGNDTFQPNFPPPTTSQDAQPNPFAVDARQEQFV